VLNYLPISRNYALDVAKHLLEDDIKIMVKSAVENYQICLFAIKRYKQIKSTITELNIEYGKKLDYNKMCTDIIDLLKDKIFYFSVMNRHIRLFLFNRIHEIISLVNNQETMVKFDKLLKSIKVDSSHTLEEEYKIVFVPLVSFGELMSIMVDFMPSDLVRIVFDYYNLSLFD
jgi:hypothetical protein